MKVYLDIDDTILHTDLFNMRPANYLKEFLTNLVQKHDVYWLTTHCNGDATVPVLYLSKFVDSDIVNLIMRIKPTKWETRKIDAINLDEDFIWFDDVLLESEKELLISKGKLSSFIKVDLDKNPDFLKDYSEI